MSENGEHMNRFGSRKFLLAILFTATGCAALLMKLIDGTAFNFLAGTVLAAHGTANIIDKRFNSNQQP